MKELNRFTKTILIIGFIFILYGYLSRTIKLYFFWESKHIGWAVLFIGTISFLYHRLKTKKTENKKTLFEKIGIGVISFILVVQVIFISIIPFTYAYKIAKNYLVNSESLKSKIGDVVGFGLISMGAIQKTTDSQGEYGHAIITFTVKGNIAYADVTVHLIKEPSSAKWQVESVE